MQRHPSAKGNMRYHSDSQSTILLVCYLKTIKYLARNSWKLKTNNK